MPDSFSPETAIQYFWGLKILANAWAMAGNYDVPSKLYPNTNVRMMPGDMATNYVESRLRIINSSKVRFSQQKDWLEKRDKLLMRVMLGLIRDRYKQQILFLK